MSELGVRSEAVLEKRWKKKKFTAFLNSLACRDTDQSGTGDSWRKLRSECCLVVPCSALYWPCGALWCLVGASVRKLPGGQ